MQQLPWVAIKGWTVQHFLSSQSVTADIPAEHIYGLLCRESYLWEISAHSSSWLSSNMGFGMKNKAPVSFLFPDSFTSIELSLYVLLLYSTRGKYFEKSPGESAQPMRACLFLTVAAGSQKTSQQYPHVDTGNHTSTCSSTISVITSCFWSGALHANEVCKRMTTVWSRL